MQFSIGVLAILMCIACHAFAQDEVRFACNGGKFGPTASTKAKLAVCHNSPEYGTEEGKKNPKCAAFCFTEAIRGLKDGLPDKTAFEQLIDSEVPEDQRKTSKELLAFCFEQHGNIDVADDKCVNIAAFSACATSLIKEINCA